MPPASVRSVQAALAGLPQSRLSVPEFCHNCRLSPGLPTSLPLPVNTQAHPAHA